MRQWRQKEGMIPFKTSSCMMAIDIWAKTCKAYVRSVRQEKGNEGKNLKKGLPDALGSNLSNFLNNSSQPQEAPYRGLFQPQIEV